MNRDLIAFGRVCFYAFIILLLALVVSIAFGADLPSAVPASTAEDWRNNPAAAAAANHDMVQSFINFISGEGFWGTVLVVLFGVLAVAKKFAPLIRSVAGPWAWLVDLAWEVGAHADQKKADNARIAVADAAHQAAPLLISLRSAAEKGQLPKAIADELKNPRVQLALECLVTEPAVAIKPATVIKVS